MAAIAEVFILIMCAISGGIFFSEKFTGATRITAGIIVVIGTMSLLLQFIGIEFSDIFSYIYDFYVNIDKRKILFVGFFGVGIISIWIGFSDDAFERSIFDPLIPRGRIVLITSGLIVIVLVLNFMPRKTADDGSNDAYIATEMNAADAMEGITNDSMTAADTNAMDAATDAMAAGADAMANAADPMTGTTNDSMTAGSASGSNRFKLIPAQALWARRVEPCASSVVDAAADGLPLCKK